MYKRLFLIILVTVLLSSFCSAERIYNYCYRNGSFVHDGIATINTLTTQGTELVITQLMDHSANTILKLTMLTTQATALTDHLNLYVYNVARLPLLGTITTLPEAYRYLTVPIQNNTTDYTINTTGWTKNLLVPGILSSMKLVFDTQFSGLQTMSFKLCMSSSPGVHVMKKTLFENRAVTSLSSTRFDRPTPRGMFDQYQCVITKTGGSYGHIYVDLYSAIDNYTAPLERDDLTADGASFSEIYEWNYPSRIVLSSGTAGVTFTATCIYYEVDR